MRGLGFARETGVDLSKIVSGARCVVLCTPVETMSDLTSRMLPALDDAAVLTDAGSVKGPIVDACESLAGGRFIGAHPIAGSDRAGIGAAHADLFQGATCVLTPTANTRTAALETARTLWESAGCRILEMSPETHDAALARTSHLPHAAASALVAVISEAVPGWENLIGGGYRDSTRIALGDSDLWTGIFMANRGELSTSIAELGEILQNLRVALDAGDGEAVRTLLASGRSARKKLDAI